MSDGSTGTPTRVARMRFAVNARALRGPLTGIGRYIVSLMAAVERDGRFIPEYFCVTKWSRDLYRAPSRIAGPHAAGIRRVLSPMRPVVREIERLHFAFGLRRRNFAFYFEPSYLPFESALPTVVTIHDLSHLRHPETHPADRVRELERKLPRAIAAAARILTVSDFTRQEVIDVFRVAPDRVVTTPLGVESRFRPRTADDTANYLTTLSLTHGRYFLALGTLEPRKNILTTVRAHARLPQRVRQAYPLVVAGMGGWLTDFIDRDLAAAQARGDVRLLGYVDDDRLPLLYAGAVMLSYPSIYEGFGLPPLEAMASGVPVAVSNRTALPEVVGDAGLLLDPLDVDTLASFMARIIDDPDLAKTLVARGLARSRSFTWERCASTTIRTWEEVIGAR